MTWTHFHLVKIALNIHALHAGVVAVQYDFDLVRTPFDSGVLLDKQGAEIVRGYSQRLVYPLVLVSSR